MFHSSIAIQNCINLVTSFAQSDANALITGETGTGKELFAQAIHGISPRSHKNLTIIDCAALPSTLVESILFGHAKGSFTGADRSRKGLIKQADVGTLFLDEIGEMPMELQKKFLRVLQEREYLPVGSTIAESSDTVQRARTESFRRGQKNPTNLTNSRNYRMAVSASILKLSAG